jgi:hypothetical protein
MCHMRRRIHVSYEVLTAYTYHMIFSSNSLWHMYPPPHMTHVSSSSYDTMYPPPHMTHIILYLVLTAYMHHIIFRIHSIFSPNSMEMMM